MKYPNYRIIFKKDKKRGTCFKKEYKIEKMKEKSPPNDSIVNTITVNKKLFIF